MAKGYSRDFIELIQNADDSLLGVKLGGICVQNDIPVNDVAEFLKVTRMTIYNWFTGKTRVRGPYLEEVKKLIKKLEQ
tara:strand:+ start:5659 stop:5892 length:234 start_codon:yes stop_codon:yes gene_type:complete